MVSAEIIGVGRYLPQKRLTTKEIINRRELDVDSKTLDRLFQISDRREAAVDESCSDMLVNAAIDIFENARSNGYELSSNILDRIIVSANPGDNIEPATATTLHNKLKATEECYAYDIKSSCVGWLTGIQNAINEFKSEQGSEYALVMAATKIKEYNGSKPQYRAMFGDGAAGVLLKKSDEKKINRYQFWTCSSLNDYIVLGYNQKSELEESFHMKFPQELEQLLEQNVVRLNKFIGGYKDRISHAFIHHPTKKLYNIVKENLNLPNASFHENNTKYGNTISADLPIDLAEKVQNGNIQKGDLLLFFTFGAGINAGTVLLEY